VEETNTGMNQRTTKLSLNPERGRIYNVISVEKQGT
jgi:hypothetical protein